MILLYICSLVPLLLFILLLLLMDSFALTNGKRLSLSILGGIISFGIWHLLGIATGLSENIFFQPVMEELLKGLVVLLFIFRKKIALLGDATIYGAAVGAGFGAIENIAFLLNANHVVITNNVTHIFYFGHEYILSEVLGEAVMMGFEAAVMHIGCTSLLAVMLIMAKNERFGKRLWQKHLAIIIAFFAAVVVHFVHKVAPIPPIIMTSVLVVYFIISKRSMFRKNERQIHEWIDDCINNEISLLNSIRNGQLSTTNAGQYLLTLKENFNGEVFFDMCCYVSEYLELSIAAKSNLILKEAGLPMQTSETNRDRISELKALKKRIGYTGLQALSPIVQIKDVDHWAMNELI